MPKNSTITVNDIQHMLLPDKEHCCGCSACAFICPVGAISMVPDEEGFSYPIIEESICIACRSCIAVCAFKADQKQ